LPTVTVDGFARSEVVDHGKTGFIIKNPGNLSLFKMNENERKIIREIVEKTSLLIEDNHLRRKMSKNCIKMIKDGKFSINQRNKQFGKIYEEALK